MSSNGASGPVEVCDAKTLASGPCPPESAIRRMETGIYLRLFLPGKPPLFFRNTRCGVFLDFSSLRRSVSANYHVAEPCLPPPPPATNIYPPWLLIISPSGRHSAVRL